MPLDIFDPGDPATRPYAFPYAPRELTGELMVSTSLETHQPRPGIMNGRIYANCTPIPIGNRTQRFSYEETGRTIDLSIPEIPAIDPVSMKEVEP